MTSKTVEDIHRSMMKKLFLESGLECVRSLPVSEETSEISEEEQLNPEEEEKAPTEELSEEEEKPPPEEEAQEEPPYLFPTPSLRKVLPDRIRKMEQLNRIHVLPETFNTEIDPAIIPKIAMTTQQKYIDTLAELVGCTKYKSSLAEFWFLDTMANLLRRAQDDEMNKTTQVILIKWFCEWMKEMQHFDAADRQRMLRRFEDNMLAAATFVTIEEYLPDPQDVEVSYMASDDLPKAVDISPSRLGAKSVTQPLGAKSVTQSLGAKSVIQPTTPLGNKSVTQHGRKSMHAQSVFAQPSHGASVTFEGAKYQCSLVDLCQIMHYIYDLFSTDYQYDLVRSIFTTTPEYTLIDAPYQLQNPKRLYAPIKIKTPKKEKSKKDEKDKGGKKRKDIIITEEYLALMALQQRDEREQEEREERDREAWNRRSHILPLNFAAEDSLFDKYWPPPPPPEPEPESEPEKQKGKGKGKKQ